MSLSRIGSKTGFGQTKPGKTGWLIARHNSRRATEPWCLSAWPSATACGIQQCRLFGGEAQAVLVTQLFLNGAVNLINRLLF